MATEVDYSKLNFNNDLISDMDDEEETKAGASVGAAGGSDPEGSPPELEEGEEGEEGFENEEEEREGDIDGEERAPKKEVKGAKGKEDEKESAGDLEPPKRLSIEDQRAFFELPRKGQELVKRIVAEKDGRIGRYGQQLQEMRQKYGDIEQVLAPRRAAMRMAGQSEAQQLHNLFQLSDFANQNTEEFIKFVAKEAGVDLVKLVQGNSSTGTGASANAGAEYVDPAMQRVLDDNSALRKELGEIKGTMQGWTKDAEHSQTVRIQRRLAEFEDAEDASGALLHPYYDEVKDQMAIILKNDLANGRSIDEQLEDAYEQAVWMTPSTRERLQRRQKKDDARERDERAREVAAKARRAAVSLPSNSNGVVRRKKEEGSVMDTLRDVMEDFGFPQ